MRTLIGMADANRRKVLTIPEWREIVKAGGVPDEGSMIYKSYAATIERSAGAASALTMGFTISTGALDRDNDTVAVSGWKFAEYLKNPVVLWAHCYDQLPVAKALSLSLSADALKSVAEFTAKDLSEFGYTVYRMYAEGFLNAVSVGFMPTKWAFVEDSTRGYGYDILEQNLLEYSAVPVPSNPEALRDAKSKGIDVAPIKAWAEKVLDGVDGPGLWLPREQAEKAYAALAAKSVAVPEPAKAAEPVVILTDAGRKAAEVAAAAQTEPALLPIGELLAGIKAHAEAVGKAGARHSKSDLESLQMCHDAIVSLGASCKRDETTTETVAAADDGDGADPEPDDDEGKAFDADLASVLKAYDAQQMTPEQQLDAYLRGLTDAPEPEPLTGEIDEATLRSIIADALKSASTAVAAAR